MRKGIRFLLGHEPREIDRIDPTMTVLEYLRRVEHRMGTKEGCAEGDCGACTVLVVRRVGDALRHEPINACIRFVPTLDGCQLLTVEDLKAPDGTLHPAQQAMVDTHGSQCGFCTPGVVMSLAALHRSGLEPTRETVDDVLAGNLCRCTGYGPIIAAAQTMAATEGSDRHLRDREPDVLRHLTEIDDGATFTVGLGNRELISPGTADDLAKAYLRHPDATILSGGTDVGLLVTKLHRQLDTVIWLGRVKELQQIEETADEIRLGAGVTYRDAAPVLASHWPELGELFRRLGAVQVRNAGTVGGNIANGSPIGDSPPALIALGASITLRHGQDRRRLPLEDFFIAYGKQDRRPGEFVESVHIPKSDPRSLFRVWKISKRSDQDISAVCGAFDLRIEDGKVTAARIAFGGMAATPKRATATEAALVGRPWTKPTVEAAMAAMGEDYRPIDDMRASAGYRLRVARNLLLKYWLESTGGVPAPTPRTPVLV
ncbi:MAG: xanthine dehydrogenase small subunit [Geminicoccaceae bacterium]